MPIASVFDMTGAKTGEMELNAAVFGIEPNELSRKPETGHSVHPDPYRGSRRRHQAVAPEGHRPCSPGFHPRSAVGSRRRSSGPEAEILQLLAEQEDQASGSALRTVR